MVKPHLSDLTLALISGSAALNALDDTYLEALSVRFGEVEVRFGKRGVYRLDRPGSLFGSRFSMARPSYPRADPGTK